MCPHLKLRVLLSSFWWFIKFRLLSVFCHMTLPFSKAARRNSLASSISLTSNTWRFCFWLLKPDFKGSWTRSGPPPQKKIYLKGQLIWGLSYSFKILYSNTYIGVWLNNWENVCTYRYIRGQTFLEFWPILEFCLSQAGYMTTWLNR